MVAAGVAALVFLAAAGAVALTACFWVLLRAIWHEVGARDEF
jgi:hypothetical protein